MARRIIAGVATVLMFSGCAANELYSGKRSLMYDSTRAAAVNASEDDLACGLEMPTGSHIAKRVCRSKAAVDSHRLWTQDNWKLMHSIRANAPLDDLDMPAVHVWQP
jgi:hypothetical protein